LVEVLIAWYEAINSSQGRLVRSLGLAVFAEEWLKLNG
jgi:hypothetical protein